jgi:hypothetical protein
MQRALTHNKRRQDALGAPSKNLRSRKPIWIDPPNGEGAEDNLALIALAAAAHFASSTFRFFVMAGLDPAIHGER